MLKKIFLSIVIALTAMSTLSAQRGYNYKSWFADLGVGVNMMYNAKQVAGFGVGSQFGIGKYIIPQCAIRLSGQFGMATSVPVDDPKWFAQSDNYYRSAVALDMLWDIVNTADEDYVNKFYHIQPYVRLQELIGFRGENKAASFSLGGGLRQTFRLGVSLDAVLDAHAALTTETAWRGTGGWLIFGQVTAGLSYRF